MRSQHDQPILEALIIEGRRFTLRPVLAALKRSA